MLLPLLYMLFVFNMCFITILLKRIRLGIFQREKNTKWIEDYLND